MSWCKSKSKRRRTIIVPKGTLDPDQNNVLELPTNLDEDTNFVVKNAGGPHGYLIVEPVAGGSDLMANGTTTANRSTHITEPPINNNNGNFRTNADFAVQVQPQQFSSSISLTPQAQTPPMQPQVSPYYQTSPPPPLPPPSNPPFQATQNYVQYMGLKENQNPHSPLCPICAALFSRSQTNNTGFLRQSAYSHLGKSSGFACPNLTVPPATNFLDTLNKSRQHLPYQSPLFSFKSETCIQPQASSQPDITKLIEQKIEETLKPILRCFSNSYPERDDNNNNSNYNNNSLIQDSGSCIFRPQTRMKTCSNSNCPKHNKLSASTCSSEEFAYEDINSSRNTKPNQANTKNKTISFLSSNDSDIEIIEKPAGNMCSRSGKCQRSDRGKSPSAYSSRILDDDDDDYDECNVSIKSNSKQRKQDDIGGKSMNNKRTENDGTQTVQKSRRARFDDDSEGEDVDLNKRIVRATSDVSFECRRARERRE